MAVTGNQIRAARALANIDQSDLASEAGINVNTIRSMEARGDAVVRVRLDTLLRVGAALRTRGVILIDKGESSRRGGVGVRLLEDDED